MELSRVSRDSIRGCFEFLADKTLDDTSGGMGLAWSMFLVLAELGEADDRMCSWFASILNLCAENGESTVGPETVIAQ